MKFTSVLSAALLAQSSFAHPGDSAEETAREVAARREYLANNKRSLAHCAEPLKARGNDVAMHRRRSAMVEQLRAKRSISQEKPYLKARDVQDSLNTNHKSNLTGITPDVDPSVIFTGNKSCILTPETTEGPYWIEGELVRQNITDGEVGIPMTLDLQLIDVNTCEPLPQIYIDIWHANSTGVYSGVVAASNGAGEADPGNLDNTALRGVQPSDKDGVATFDTVFPGHYIGRATHIHVLTKTNATLNTNSTVSGGHVSHVGQIYFDQDLITLADTIEPYASNQQPVTLNADDYVLLEAGDADPFLEYVMLGDDITDGIFAWLAFGMDSNSTQKPTPAVWLTEEGGVENPNARDWMADGGAAPKPSA